MTILFDNDDHKKRTEAFSVMITTNQTWRCFFKMTIIILNILNDDHNSQTERLRV